MVGGGEGIGVGHSRHSVMLPVLAHPVLPISCLQRSTSLSTTTPAIPLPLVSLSG